MVRIVICFIGVMALGCSQLSVAGDFDGGRALQCKTTEGVQYHRNGNPQPFHPESVGLPESFIVDFKQKAIRPTRQSVIRKRSKIKRVEPIEDKIMLQGVDEGVEGVNDGVGWTMSLRKKNGHFVITASGGDLGYIVFGRCRASVP